MKKTSLLTFILLTLIVIAGLWFRWKGISQSYSFWSDEAYVASLSREILLGKENLISIQQKLGYQPLYITLTTFSLMIFGLNETAARLPSVFFGSLGIVFAFLLAQKLSNRYGGVLGAFLYSFSQMNLVYSTQAKPYIIQQALFILELYFITKLLEKNSRPLWLHIGIIVTASCMTLLHLLGIIAWIPYLTYLLLEKRTVLQEYIRKPKYILGIGILMFILASLFKLDLIMNAVFKIIKSTSFIPFNHTIYFKELFLKQYLFLTLPGIFGSLLILKKYRTMFIGLFIWTGILIFFWNFFYFAHNIRYVVPLFGVIFVLNGVFWGEIGEKLFRRKSWLAPLIVITILFVSGYKIVRKPSAYYNPNADFYGDVQIADYKKTFLLLKQQYPVYKKLPIFNDTIDPQWWYLETTPTVYFMKGIVPSVKHANDGHWVHGDLQSFLKAKSTYSKGLLIVEDWESILPEEIKQYAKKNMKREIRVEGIPEAKGDNWPIEVYSWGL